GESNRMDPRYRSGWNTLREAGGSIRREGLRTDPVEVGGAELSRYPCRSLRRVRRLHAGDGVPEEGPRLSAIPQSLRQASTGTFDPLRAEDAVPRPETGTPRCEAGSALGSSTEGFRHPSTLARFLFRFLVRIEVVK